MSGADDMDRVLSGRLRSLDDVGRMRLARQTLERLGSRFAADVCALLIEELDAINGADLQTWLETLPDTANGAWLRLRGRGSIFFHSALGKCA